MSLGLSSIHCSLNKMKEHRYYLLPMNQLLYQENPGHIRSLYKKTSFSLKSMFIGQFYLLYPPIINVLKTSTCFLFWIQQQKYHHKTYLVIIYFYRIRSKLIHRDRKPLTKVKSLRILSLRLSGGHSQSQIKAWEAPILFSPQQQPLPRQH